MIEGIAASVFALGGIGSLKATNNYNVNYELLNKTLAKEGIYYNIGNIDDIYNMIGENQYLKVETYDKYLIIDKADYSVLEEDVLINNPYANYSGSKIYFDSEFGVKYFGIKNNNIYDLKTNNLIDFSKINYESFKNDVMPKDDDYEEKKDDNFYYGDMKYCDNYYYFENLHGDRHAANDDNSCAIVATEILLSYYDTFLNDNVVEEMYEYKVEDSFDSVKEFKIAPGSDRGSIDRKFKEHLVNKYAPDHKEDTGYTNSQQYEVIKGYLNDLGLEYKLKYSLEDNIADIMENESIKVIKNAISNGRPLIANTFDHSMVAYAYNNDYLYLHTGWGRVVRMKWKFFKSSIVYGDWYNPFSTEILTSGAIDIHFNINHVHSDNYYSTSLDSGLCPCGKAHNHSITHHELDSEFHINECTCGICQKEKHSLIMELTTSKIKLFTKYITIPVIKSIYCKDCEYGRKE